jgi:hypothetical protein
MLRRATADSGIMPTDERVTGGKRMGGSQDRPKTVNVVRGLVIGAKESFKHVYSSVTAVI